MSDARNSSGNIRGGGARQTGGAGRTQKNAGEGGNSKGSGITGLSSQKLDKKLLARRNLQLLTMSKKLALEAKKACFEEHAEEEYIEMNIPIPDPESALKKLRSMTKFTDDWHDSEFRERWLLTVLKVWNVELKAEFEAAAKAFAANDAAREKFESDKAAKRAAGKTVGTSASGNDNAEGVPVSTKELEAMLEDVTLSAEERKKVKKKLKKRKQKANKKKNGDDDNDGD